MTTDTRADQVLCGLALGEAQLLSGRPEEALPLAEQALALDRERQERGHEAYALRLLGDIAARRMVQAARGAAAWPAKAARSAADNLSEYLVEEQPMLARKDDVLRWSQEVDALRDATERLEKRIMSLAQRDPSR